MADAWWSDSECNWFHGTRSGLRWAMVVQQVDVFPKGIPASAPQAQTLSHNSHINSSDLRHNMVINSIEDRSGLNCVDVIGLPDGQFTFKVFRKDPEDQGRWTLVGDYSGLRFSTEEKAIRQAATQVRWLGDLLLSPPNR